MTDRAARPGPDAGALDDVSKTDVGTPRMYWVSGGKKRVEKPARLA